MRSIEPPIWLASRSPRRREMMEQTGLEVRVLPPDVDDAALDPGRVSPCEWVMSLAYLKAQRVKDMISTAGAGQGRSVDVRGTVLGADTVCVASDGAILGQPRDADDARRMLRQLRNAQHETITGVCLLPLASDQRYMFCDRAIVHVGDVSDQQIERYVDSGDWRGKAGAYNLSERIEAGWPIECRGDPATVMGLPMKRLKRQFGF